jgi:hypothetical protein
MGWEACHGGPVEGMVDELPFAGPDSDSDQNSMIHTQVDKCALALSFVTCLSHLDIRPQ